MTLVDTSSWIEALRKNGDPKVQKRVKNLFLTGEVAWCDMILLELWNGARGQYEKKQLKALEEEEVTCLQISSEVWKLASEIAKKCRSAGKTIPCSDIIIATCATFYGVTLDFCDNHFDTIFKVAH